VTVFRIEDKYNVSFDIPFKDPFEDWQNGADGNYFSSWGPEEDLRWQLSSASVILTCKGQVLLLE